MVESFNALVDKKNQAVEIDKMVLNLRPNHQSKKQINKEKNIVYHEKSYRISIYIFRNCL